MPNIALSKIGVFSTSRKVCDSMKKAAFILGFAGVVPFVGLGAVGLLSPTYGSAAAGLQKDYAVVILAFLGAMHWGATLTGGQTAHLSGRYVLALTWGVVPALWAWFASGLPFHNAMVALMAGLGAALLVDVLIRHWYRWPNWFMPLRLALTVGAALGCTLTLLST
jgi:hypothetical protein